MLRRMKLQTKLLTIGILLSVIPLLVVSMVVFQQSNKRVNIAGEESSFLEEFYEAENRIAAIGKTNNTVLLCVLGAASLSAALIWFFVARRVTGRINQVVAQLTESPEQDASAPCEVSAASRSLSVGSSPPKRADGQAGTSLSLEEVVSMTKQNADNAQQANTLMSEACKTTGRGSDAVARMNNAINKIEKSSDKTAKAIKVIDEIAFQRNLFALNVIDEIAFQTNLLASDAAVKAARVGDASKGFAMVAEEIRNLATHSAEAAKNTAGMMEKSAKNGVDVTAEVTKVLEEIMQSFGRTTGLVAEIAATLQEQTEDIKQTNTSLPGWMIDRRLSS